MGEVDRISYLNTPWSGLENSEIEHEREHFNAQTERLAGAKQTSMPVEYYYEHPKKQHLKQQLRHRRGFSLNSFYLNQKTSTLKSDPNLCYSKQASQLDHYETYSHDAENNLLRSEVTESTDEHSNETLPTHREAYNKLKLYENTPSNPLYRAQDVSTFANQLSKMQHSFFIFGFIITAFILSIPIMLTLMLFLISLLPMVCLCLLFSTSSEFRAFSIHTFSSFKSFLLHQIQSPTAKTLIAASQEKAISAINLYTHYIHSSVYTEQTSAQRHLNKNNSIYVQFKVPLVIAGLILLFCPIVLFMSLPLLCCLSIIVLLLIPVFISLPGILFISTPFFVITTAICSFPILWSLPWFEYGSFLYHTLLAKRNRPSTR